MLTFSCLHFFFTANSQTSNTSFKNWFHRKMAKFFHVIPGLCFITHNLVMGNLLYIIAVILVIAWAIGFLGFHAGGIIHILLVIAVIAFVIKLIKGNA